MVRYGNRPRFLLMSMAGGLGVALLVFVMFAVMSPAARNLQDRIWLSLFVGLFAPFLVAVSSLTQIDLTNGRVRHLLWGRWPLAEKRLVDLVEVKRGLVCALTLRFRDGSRMRFPCANFREVRDLERALSRELAERLEANSSKTSLT
jgi:hypothetical protein